ncbi:hypothetical protein HanPSC8_Chr15g0670731 [Helianthus annuus]|nr:hypothetical protein HanPSC8_Chr15g0670731 [Helianthus annuus]
MMMVENWVVVFLGVGSDVLECLMIVVWFFNHHFALGIDLGRT